MIEIGALESVGLLPAQRSSDKKFPDGADFRIEIPSVEGPRVLEAVIDTADELSVTVNRVAQGSGGMLLSSTDLRAVAEMGRHAGLEVSLFVGPRAGFDIGVVAHLASSHYAAIRGSDQLMRAAQDVERSAEHGIRSFLVGDVGLLRFLSELRFLGDLPSDCSWKVSGYFPSANGSTVRVLEDLGAGTINVPPDLDLTQLAELRAATDLPLDMYVEVSESMGGVTRIMDIDRLIEAAAPLHVKFGLLNSGSEAYPSGTHTIERTIDHARAKVHRAAVALEWLSRSEIAAIQSKPHASGIAVPIL